MSGRSAPLSRGIVRDSVKSPHAETEHSRAGKKTRDFSLAYKLRDRIILSQWFEVSGQSALRVAWLRDRANRGYEGVAASNLAMMAGPFSLLVRSLRRGQPSLFPYECWKTAVGSRAVMPTNRCRSRDEPGSGSAISRTRAGVMLLAGTFSAASVLADTPSTGPEDKRASSEKVAADSSKATVGAGSSTAKGTARGGATSSSVVAAQARCAHDGSDEYTLHAQAESFDSFQACRPVGLDCGRAADRASPPADHCLPVTV